MKTKINYQAITKSSYETSRGNIAFMVTINGKQAIGYWNAQFDTVSRGVDTNELSNGIHIFDGGGGRRHYELHATLQRAKRQPKSLQFTGHTLDVSNLKTIFVDAITKALAPDYDGPKLHQSFLTYFKLYNHETAN